MNNRPTVSVASSPAADSPGGDGMQVRLLRFGSMLAELFGVGRSTIYRTIARMRPKPVELERPFA
jgi:predicted DNA-binding transcriptional regulator AlpA